MKNYICKKCNENFNPISFFSKNFYLNYYAYEKYIKIWIIKEINRSKKKNLSVDDVLKNNLEKVLFGFCLHCLKENLSAFLYNEYEIEKGISICEFCKQNFKIIPIDHEDFIINYSASSVIAETLAASDNKPPEDQIKYANALTNSIYENTCINCLKMSLSLCYESDMNMYVENDKESFYQSYLETTHWKIVRSSCLQFYNYKCQICNSENNLHIHHNNYKNLGKEIITDLVVLCKNCHGKFHDKV